MLLLILLFVLLFLFDLLLLSFNVQWCCCLLCWHCKHRNNQIKSRILERLWCSVIVIIIWWYCCRYYYILLCHCLMFCFFACCFVAQLTFYINIVAPISVVFLSYCSSNLNFVTLCLLYLLCSVFPLLLLAWRYF